MNRSIKPIVSMKTSSSTDSRTTTPENLISIGSWQLTLSQIAAVVIVCAITGSLSGLWVPLGISAEADAVDYRIPLIQWIIRHRTYPNWAWSGVDDYPMLGELLMLPLYAIKSSWARLVPILAYLSTGLMGGLLYRQINRRHSRSGFLLAIAWTLSLRTLAIQSNLLMVDNLASLLILGALLFLIGNNEKIAGTFAAFALATRYSALPAFAALISVSCFLTVRRKGEIKQVGIFLLISSFGILPFALRNLFINGNPFFPLFQSVFGPTDVQILNRYDHYGRGTGILDLIRLPWDLLITNEFGKNLFDYTLGRIFILQTAVVGFLAFKNRKCLYNLVTRIQLRASYQALALFTCLHILTWFYSAQQLRFLVPSIIILQLGLFVICHRFLNSRALAILTLTAALSIASAHKETILVAIGTRKLTFFEKRKEDAQACFSRLPQISTPIGHSSRDGTLGFLNHDFAFVGAHPYAIAYKNWEKEWPDLIYPGPNFHFDNEPGFSGYQPWPVQNPCVFRRSS